MLRRLAKAWLRALRPAPLPDIDPALQAAAARCYRERFRNRMNPPVSFRIAADEGDYVVVEVFNRDPGCVDFIRVTKADQVATLVEADRLKYRPRGLK